MTEATETTTKQVEFDLECVFCGAWVDEQDKGVETDADDNAWHIDCLEEHEDLIGSKGMALLEHVRAQGDPLTGAWEIEEIDGYRWECLGVTYLVLTDDEADERAEQGAQSYLDTVELPQVPEHLRTYFDEERWIENALAGNGREFWIGSDYEDYIDSEYDGETYYIYQR